MVRRDAELVTYTLPSTAALAELERPITATATSAMSASPESNFTESFTASVPLTSAFLPTTTAEGRNNLLPPLPGGMKPGDLLYLFILSARCGKFAGSVISFQSKCTPTSARGIRPRDKPKRFNHRNEYDVNPLGIEPSSIFTTMTVHTHPFPGRRTDDLKISSAEL